MKQNFVAVRASTLVVVCPVSLIAQVLFVAWGHYTALFSRLELELLYEQKETSSQEAYHDPQTGAATLFPNEWSGRVGKPAPGAEAVGVGCSPASQRPPLATGRFETT